MVYFLVTRKHGWPEMTQAYPLQWPPGQPRTPDHQRERNWKFRTSQDVAQRKVISEISMLGGRNAVISTNIPLRRDGLPYASYSQKRGEDCGVAVYFSLNSQPMCFACDKWDNYADNMTSIAKTIEALRGIERWGSGHMMKQAFSGFAALPAPYAPKNWRAVLGVFPDATLEAVERAYRALLMTRHPDKGGSHEAMAELNAARDQARRELA